MSRRLELHRILVKVLGSKNVYFQPPATVKLSYPCIIYNRSQIDTKPADDKLYAHTIGYMVMTVDPNPDSELPNKILNLPLSRFVRQYTADNLNHDVFNVFY